MTAQFSRLLVRGDPRRVRRAALLAALPRLRRPGLRRGKRVTLPATPHG